MRHSSSDFTKFESYKALKNQKKYIYDPEEYKEIPPKQSLARNKSVSNLDAHFQEKLPKQKRHTRNDKNAFPQIPTAEREIMTKE